MRFEIQGGKCRFSGEKGAWTWIVGSTEGAEVESHHVDIGVAEPKRGIPVELYRPARLDGSNGIQQEPSIGEVDVN